MIFCCCRLVEYTISNLFFYQQEGERMKKLVSFTRVCISLLDAAGWKESDQQWSQAKPSTTGKARPPVMPAFCYRHVHATISQSSARGHANVPPSYPNPTASNRMGALLVADQRHYSSWCGLQVGSPKQGRQRTVAVACWILVFYWYTLMSYVRTYRCVSMFVRHIHCVDLSTCFLFVKCDECFCIHCVLHRICNVHHN